MSGMARIKSAETRKIFQIVLAFSFFFDLIYRRRFAGESENGKFFNFSSPSSSRPQGINHFQFGLIISKNNQVDEGVHSASKHSINESTINCFFFVPSWYMAVEKGVDHPMIFPNIKTSSTTFATIILERVVVIQVHKQKLEVVKRRILCFLFNFSVLTHQKELEWIPVVFVCVVKE